MPEHIPIAEAEHIAERYGFSQVFIFARTPGEDGVEHLVTYGTDMENSAAAAAVGKFLKEKIMGWPAGDDAEVGERVALARQAPELKRQRDMALDALKGVVAALESPEWNEWEVKAVQHETRTRAHELGVEDAVPFGYRGPQFMPAVRAAIAECGE